MTTSSKEEDDTTFGEVKNFSPNSGGDYLPKLDAGVRVPAPAFNESVKLFIAQGVAPRKCNKKKSEATPEEWAAYLLYMRRLAARPDQRAKSRTRDAKWSSAPANRQKRREADRRYRAKPEAKVKRACRERERRDEDIQYRIRKYLRSRVSDAVTLGLKAGSAVRDLGCTGEFLKGWLEAQFQPGMSWENWGNGHGKWCIDHLYPLAAADLTDRTQFLAANNFRNLQPLWFEENATKGDSIQPEALALFTALSQEMGKGVAA
jgi:hypothetical protein